MLGFLPCVYVKYINGLKVKTKFYESTTKPRYSMLVRNKVHLTPDDGYAAVVPDTDAANWGREVARWRRMFNIGASITVIYLMLLQYMIKYL